MPSFNLNYYYPPSTDKKTEAEKVKHISQGQVVVTNLRSEFRKPESLDENLEIR